MERGAVTPAEWIRSLRSRGLFLREIGEAAGVSVDQVARWQGNTNLPSMANAEAIAERYDVPGFVESVRAARTRTCIACETTFLMAARSRHDSCFCSETCRRRVGQTRHRAGIRDARLIRVLRVNERLQAENVALLATMQTHCDRCEPDRLCREGDCAWHLRTKHACVAQGCGSHRVTRPTVA